MSKRQRIWIYASLVCAPLTAIGCGGTPETGAKAVMPADYEQKRDAIQEGFLKKMKEDRAAPRTRPQQNR